MGIETLRAAKTICASKNWQLSNLPLQKLLYLSHMLHMGVHGVPLIDGRFEAWDLGPVEPNLYGRVKAYGNKPIPDIFPVDTFEAGSLERTTIDHVVSQLGDKPASKLVEITHQPHGAWALHYRPQIRGITIPNKDIKSEYDKRLERMHAKRNA